MTWCDGLCRAVVKPPTSTDTNRVFGCYYSHTTPEGSAEGITFTCHRYAPRWERSNGEARATVHGVLHISSS